MCLKVRTLNFAAVEVSLASFGRFFYENNMW
jgi:hypothetical protein